MVVLTKSDVINGKEARKEVYIKLLDQEISLKPLTDGEYHRFIALTKDVGLVKADIDEKTGTVDMDSQERKMSMNMDLKKQAEATFRAECLVAAFGLSSDKETWLPEDVKLMKPIGVVTEISNAVIKISGIDDPEKLDEDVDEFRDE